MSPIQCIEELRKSLESLKPNDRSSRDRKFAIAITSLDKLEAFIMYWGLNNG